MKKTITNRTHHPQYIQLFLAVLFLVLSAGQSLQAQQNEQSRQEVSADRIFSGEDLRQINPVNLWEAIKQLEPSLSESDEESYGSDPNHIPDGINLRGSHHWPSQSAQPVFILDNAIVDARRIRDLNINEVAELAIRKDAATLTPYGLRGSNGAIEIRTIRPTSGPIRLSYSFDGSFKRADLSSWNLLNATEKLELEKEHGLYQSQEPETQQQLQQWLRERENAIAGGINTNWLKVPLQTAFSHRHKIDVYGGDEFIRYKFTLRAAPGAKGVMKKSKRDIYGGDAYLEYRYRSFTLSNCISIDKIHAQASPYGSFSYYSMLNPYFAGQDAEGLLYNSLGENSFNEQANPLFETSLSSFSKQESIHLYNNFTAGYSFLNHFRLNGRFIFIRDHAQNDFYLSPESYVFSKSSSNENKNAGVYEITHNNRLTLEGQANLSYNQSYIRSEFGANIGLNVFQGKYDYDTYAGTGIPIDRMSFISFATSYDTSQKPDAQEDHDRMLSGILSARYNFDKRYEVRLQMRVDKSSLLAPEKCRAGFYGGSVAWNIHREKFLKDKRSINRLTLQAAIGSSGDIGFTSSAHTLTYSYNIGNEYIYNYYLLGAKINSLNNPSLKWSTTQNKNITLQAETHGVILGIQYYDNTTRNLPVIVPAALATGFDHMPGNGGRIRNNGIEYSLSVKILGQKDGFRLNVFTNGVHHQNKITAVPAYFANLYNQNAGKQQSDKILYPTLLRQGESVNTLYIVPIYTADKTLSVNQKKSRNYEDSWQNVIAAGTTTPKLKGTFGFQFSYKQWHLNTHFYYSTGGKIYNSTLANTLLGNPAYNMDRRILSQPDIKQGHFFVEKRNETGLGTVRAGYEFTPETAAKLHMQQCSIYLTGNQLFHYCSANYQRGLLYPFARTITVSLRATF